MFSIGEFSQLTQLPVKTLRFYHDEGLLIAAHVDPDTGYRYYQNSQVETARIIVYLRNLEFSLSEIKSLLHTQGDDDLLNVLERQRSAIHERIKQLRQAVKSLDQFIAAEKETRIMVQTVDQIQEKVLDPLLVAGIRMKGRYSDCGPLFGRLGRSLGRHIAGRPLLLHFDNEYREDDADFEACMPIRGAKTVEGASVRELPGGRCVSLVHRGPYEQLGRSYAKVFEYLNAHKFKVLSPTREVYLKGPGMILKGNPKNYLTEIQVLVDGDT
ncbi:MAG TPA: MerR family transcriptional regulator [Pirellulales bacterium]|nr:MerR family transcriptional regulator [Pirellulales bacterium]